MHNYGAIASLEKLMQLVHHRGFILMNDYGTDKIRLEEEFEHQRFSLATFVGVNFALLGEYFRDKTSYHWKRPVLSSPSVHSALLSHNRDDATHEKFMELFGQREQKRLHEPVDKARQWLQVGRFELAGSEYEKAVKQQPYNWVLLNEVAMFLIFQQRDLKKGINMAKLALAQNPTCSAELWNTLGDGLFEFGRLAEARSAYLRALRVNDADVRARFNLSWVFIREKNYAAALRVIAEGLALDKTGEYRDRFLQKQQEALAHLQLRHQQEYLLLINLVSRHSPSDGSHGKPAVAKQDEAET